MTEGAILLPDRSTDQYHTRSQRFTYTLLLKDEIRLAVLSRNRHVYDYEPVKLDLVTVKWPSPTPYEALSYVWGVPTKTTTVLVSADGAAHRPHKVTWNLDAALRQLRRSARTRCLWIDALCIDQNNMEEKEQEVSKMDQIYQAADSVCVWLGGGSPKTDDAMAVVPEILKSVSSSSSARRLDQAKGWKSFENLLRNDWFSRRWVIQEIALARSARVCCGSKSVSWTDFSDALSLYVSRPASSQGVSSAHPNAQKLGASTLGFLSHNALRKDTKGNVVERRWNVEDLLALLPMFEAQVPHDTIYAVLSIASDSSMLPPVDYNKTPGELFTQVFQHIAVSSSSFDIIFRPWAPDVPEHTLPSFIAPASRQSHIRDSHGKYRRRNADSLVGAPRRRIYAATPNASIRSLTLINPEQPAREPPGRAHRPIVGTAGDLRRLLQLDLPPRNSANVTLEMKGLVCAIITEVGGVCEDGNIPPDWLATWQCEWERLEPDLWRVVVAGRSRDGTEAPNWYRRAFEHVFQPLAAAAEAGRSEYPERDERGGRRDLSLHEMIKTTQSSNIADFLRRMSACVWGRRFLVSTGEDGAGYIGLVPREAEPGDMICLFEGCSVPVVFRGSPMADLARQALQAVQAALVALGGLAPAIEERIISLLHYMVSKLSSETVISAGLTPELQSSVVVTFAEKFREFEVRGLLKKLPEGVRVDDELRRLFKPGLGQSLTPILTEPVSRLLRDVLAETRDDVSGTVLQSFFMTLIQEVVGQPSNALLLPISSVQRQSFADSLGPESLWPLFARTFERALGRVFGAKWRREVKLAIIPQHSEDEVVTHSIQFEEKMVNTVLEAVWPAAWEAAWDTSKGFLTGWLGELGVDVWEESLQGALRHCAKAWYGSGPAGSYGGKVVGECYVQGLMDGEGWDAKEMKERVADVFVVA